MSDNKLIKIYLDNCCYNRPYDDLTQFTVGLEAQAKLHIQQQIKDGKYDLVTSEMLTYELDANPFQMRKDTIQEFIKRYSAVHVGPGSTKAVREIAASIMAAGVKYKDACHVASAILAGCEYFVTTDKRLLKYKSKVIKLVNPIDFVMVTEEGCK